MKRKAVVAIGGLLVVVCCLSINWRASKVPRFLQGATQKQQYSRRVTLYKFARPVRETIDLMYDELYPNSRIARTGNVSVGNVRYIVSDGSDSQQFVGGSIHEPSYPISTVAAIQLKDSWTESFLVKFGLLEPEPEFSPARQ